MHSSAVNFIRGVEQLFLAIAGHRGLPLFASVWLKSRAARVINFLRAGFVDRTRPAIRSLKPLFISHFFSLDGSA